jgi:hypothetical protein
MINKETVPVTTGPMPEQATRLSRLTAVDQEIGDETQAAGRSDDLSVTLYRLVELLSEPDEDEFGIARPSKHAFCTALHLMTDAAVASGGHLPRGNAATDTEGGIYLIWKQSSREVRLAIPHSHPQAPYIYRRETSQGSAIENEVTGEKLTDALQWLTRQ